MVALPKTYGYGALIVPTTHSPFFLSLCLDKD